jgi:capsular exopolysaccharide synthesis family protein
LGEISDALRRAREGLRREPASASVAVAAAPPAPLREAASANYAPLRDAANAVTIPTDPEGDWHGRAVLAAPRSEIAEGYRHFAIRLQRKLKEMGARSVIVTSAARGEGKTTTASNLAQALASMSSGRRIAFIELDVRRPSASRAFGITPQVGIERVLVGQARVAEACMHTQLPELDLYLVAAPARDPLGALSAATTGQMLRDLARQYDLLVIDSPPVLPVPDVPLLAAHVDAVLLVARNGVSRRAALRETIESVGDAKLIGVFLNEGKTPRHRRYYGYYGYEESPKAPEAESEQ